MYSNESQNIKVMDEYFLSNPLEQSLLHYVPMVTIQKWGKEHFSSFFLQSLHACNSKSIKDTLMPF